MDVDTINFDQITKGEKLGKGTYGTVFKAQWLNKTVAIKEININVNYENVKREFKQLSRADHVNIIFLHGISLHDDLVYLIMEYADGGSLHDFLHIGEPIEYSLPQAISWALQCSKGVAYLHGKSVIHRDLKPLNIMLSDERRCLKISDFGTVRQLATNMTESRGTAAYMAPEVFNGKKYTEKCDVYSWAITMWELLSRKVPYKHLRGDLKICYEVDKGVRPSLDELQFDLTIDDPLVKLMTDCWKVDPNERHRMDAIVEALSKYDIDSVL